jgi:cytochrome c oxidase assembly factor CtaG
VRAALAHGPGPEAAAAHAAWTLDPWVVLPLHLATVLHLGGSWRLRAASPDLRRELRRRALLYWPGLAVLALALVSPLHRVADHLFTAHMVVHELLMVVAASLLVSARPGPVLLWGLPRPMRRWAGAFLRRPAPQALWAGARELWSATLLHAAALWAWHLPGPFLVATGHGGFHLLQHACFFGSALLFWQAALRPAVRGQAVLALFATSLQAGLLGSLLTFSRMLWYPGAGAGSGLWGLTPLDDQVLAGLVMWIPACSVYALAAVALMGFWLAKLGSGARHA